MPKLLAAISLIGTLAMLWVGGHILLVSLDEIGGPRTARGHGLGDVLHAPYDLIHHWEEDVHDAVGGRSAPSPAGCVNTLLSAVVGLVVGGIVVAVLHAFGRSATARERCTATAEHGATGAERGRAPDEPVEDSPNR